MPIPAIAITLRFILPLLIEVDTCCVRVMCFTVYDSKRK